MDGRITNKYIEQAVLSLLTGKRYMTNTKSKSITSNNINYDKNDILLEKILIGG
jgi:hypothetical protein